LGGAARANTITSPNNAIIVFFIICQTSILCNGLKPARRKKFRGVAWQLNLRRLLPQCDSAGSFWAELPFFAI
jgi:hypothetical protein